PRWLRLGHFAEKTPARAGEKEILDRMRRAGGGRRGPLAANLGGAFLFMRLAAPTPRPGLTAALRARHAGVPPAIYFGVTRFDAEYRRWGRHYVIVGIVSSAVPFLLWAYAALSVSAGLLSVLNATSPMFGAVCSAVLLRERLNAPRV